MSDDKKYPASTKGIGALLNLGDDHGGATGHGLEEVMAPENLPISPEKPQAHDAKTVSPVSDAKQTSSEPVNVQSILGVKNEGGEDVEKSLADHSPLLNLLKKSTPYLIVFIAGFVIFIFFFQDFSVTKILDKNRLKIQDLVKSKASNGIEELQKQLSGDYDKWIAQFFFAVKDTDIVDMDVDVSGNGLTNFQKFLFDLNPKVYSTRGGMGDGEALIKGINPWTGAALSAEQKDLVSKYINSEVINNRIAGAITNKSQNKFSRYVDPDSPYYKSSAVNTNLTAPPTGVPPEAQGQGVNFSIPGKLDIPALSVSVPLIWTSNVKNFDADLKKGVVHYPGTASPGEPGVGYISGHSSGYAWDKNKYKTVFAQLGDLKIGDTFTIFVQKNNGEQVVYRYAIENRGEYDPGDQAQFIGDTGSVVALSTCWPIGTTDRRLVLFGRLFSTDEVNQNK